MVRLIALLFFASLSCASAQSTISPNATTGGTAAPASSAAGGVYLSSPSTLTSGQQATILLDSGHRQVVSLGSSSVTVYTMPPLFTGNGSLATSTASALINTMTVNSTGGALPSTLAYLVVANNGTTDVAFCAKGGTCTCSGNAVAATNGLTVKAGYAAWQVNLTGVASSTPSIVACSGTPTVEFMWGS